MSQLTAAQQAAEHSKAHQKWILDTLATSGGTCTYEKLVEVGEEHQCDTVGAMLKILKNRKAITYKQMFLMYPMHKDEVVSLVGDGVVAGGSGESQQSTSAPATKPAARKPKPTKPDPKPLAHKMQAVSLTPKTEAAPAAPAPSTGSSAPPAADGEFFSYEQLKAPGPYPAGVDISKRETYLSPEKTEELFGMTKEALASMPGWKRNNLKKKVQLF